MKSVWGDFVAGRISLDAFEAKYDGVIESDCADHAKDLLGLNDYEWTAYSQGLPFELLREWAVNGWPDICTRCGKSLRINDFGWLVHEGPNGLSLVHVEC
jgi:hypothetical protein